MSAVRPMVVADVAGVRRVETSAGRRFRSVDDPRVARCADDEPYTESELEAYVAFGRAWVALDGGEVAGFVVVDLVDACAHVEEIAVATEFGRRGYGRALIDEVDRWASSADLPALTLTTFRDVPWNGPWYESLGFRVLGEDELTQGLRERRRAEEEHGLPAELRVVMRREVAEARSIRPARGR